MVAATTYYQGKNAKTRSQIDKVDRRLAGKYETLGKKLETLDRALAAVEKLAQEIDEIKNDRSQKEDMLVFLDHEESDMETDQDV